LLQLNKEKLGFIQIHTSLLINLDDKRIHRKVHHI
jgi:hypothetical protein